MEWKDWLPIVIAVAAVFITIMQVYLQRRHDRLTVRPHLNLRSIENVTDDNVAEFKLVLKNIGMGPALFKTYQVQDDGKPIHFQELAARRSIDGLTIKNEGFEADERFGLAPNEEQVICHIIYRCGIPEAFDTFLKSLVYCDIAIDYTSIYEDEIFELRHTGKDLNKRKVGARGSS